MVITDVTAAARSFIKRVQLHPQISGQFRRVMSDYSSHKLDVHGVISELDILFRFHPHLLTGYRFFLPPQFRPSSSPPQPRHPQKNNVDIITKLNPCIHFMNKLQKRFADERGVILAYLETIRALTKGKLFNDDAYDAIARIFGNENQDLVDEFELLLVGDNRGTKRSKKKKEAEEAKFKNDEKSNLLPSNSNNDDEIKPRKKKVNFFNCMEDEMFELDMHLYPLRTTIESANALKKILQSQQHQLINIDSYFSAVSLSCIRKEYKEQGCFVIKQLREDPKHLLPQILEQLERKEKELAESRKKLHQRWYGFHKKK
ncbi:unnamed protein product [Withania somnifera]